MPLSAAGAFLFILLFIMNIDEARNLFPYIKNGTIYFNHAALGPLSSKVVEKINYYLDERSRSNIMNYESFVEIEKKAKGKLSRLLGSAETRIAWTDNVSNALNLLAQSVYWKAGDRIILNNIEFPANVYPFLNLRKQGVEIDFAQAKNGIVTADDIESLISPRTKLISVSLVQFLSGYRIDINRLGDICRSNGIIFCVDAIQAAGAVNINVQDSKIDFLAGGAQKWLMALQGLSYLYISETLQESIDPKYVGWLSVEDAWNFLDYNLTLKKTAERFQNGTQNALGIVALNESLDLFENFGYVNIENNIMENSGYFIDSLQNIGIKTFLSSEDKKHLSGIVSIKVIDPQAFFDKIMENKINCALREGIIRFSPHFYNTRGEIDSAIDTIKSITKSLK